MPLMCPECERLRKASRDASDLLMSAQYELARFKSGQHNETFQRLWKTCETALKTSLELREEMAKHAASHADTGLSTGQ
jgi:flagellar motility protein MotE (MotC chaperone)